MAYFPGRTPAQRLEEAERRIAALERKLAVSEASAYREIQADGVAVPRRQIVNFIAATVADNPVNGRTDIT